MNQKILTILAALSTGAWAEEPWGAVDLQAGKTMHDKTCTSCHIRMYGGDGSKMYSRDGRMLSDKLELLQRSRPVVPPLPSSFSFRRSLL